jgi:hypothetical protein
VFEKVIYGREERAGDIDAEVRGPFPAVDEREVLRSRTHGN